MSQRQLNPDGKCSFGGQVEVDFSFILNGTGAISLATSHAGTQFRGGGILPGGSITYGGSTGVINVQLDQGHSYRYVVAKTADLDDTPNDGAYATIGNVTNEGSGKGLAFTIYTRAAAGTLTNFTGRRCQVLLSCKNTDSGS